MQINNIFDLVRCGICGVPWAEHPSACPGDIYRAEARVRLHAAMAGPRWPATERLLRLNGWAGPGTGEVPNGRGE